MPRIKTDQAGHEFGVLWDMDGVLADTGELHYQSWAVALHEVGIPFNREQFRMSFGMNNHGILTYLRGTPPTHEFLTQVSDHKEGLFREMMRGLVQPHRGVREWLERLHQENIPMAVASSAPLANVEALVDELCIRGYFSALLSGYDLPGKPDPATFLKAAQMIRKPPEKCIVVEDAIAGVQAARRAGMHCIAVTTTNPETALGDADIIVERLDQLPPETFHQLIKSPVKPYPGDYSSPAK